MSRNILVTGGAGFIGGHLVARLLARGDRVTVLDDLSSGRAETVTGGVRLVPGSVLDRALLDDLVRDQDCIYHLAALVSVQLCITDWNGGHRANLGGTMAVLQAAARAGVPVVYASSAAVYGNRSGGMCREDDLPLPISPYAADKLAGEHQARAMAEIHGLASVGLRFFNVYGPGQDAASPYAGVISRFCANRRAGRAHVIYGDGLQSRDFIYVGDVADGLIAAGEAVRQGGAQVYNLCTGAQITLLDLAAQLDAVAGPGRTPITHQPARDGDVRSSRGCPMAARQGLGFNARTSIGEGLAALWAAQPKGAVG